MYYTAWSSKHTGMIQVQHLYMAGDAFWQYPLYMKMPFVTGTSYTEAIAFHPLARIHTRITSYDE